MFSATPQATLTHLSCSPNFPCASYLDECMLTYEPIVNWLYLLSKWMASLHSKGLMTHTYIKISTASFFNPSGQILLNKMSIGVIFHRVLSINNKSNKTPGAIKINCKSNILICLANKPLQAAGTLAQVFTIVWKKKLI